MGMFGLAEITRNLENEGEGETIVQKVASLMPTREDWKRMK
jgi:TctA family transporter